MIVDSVRAGDVLTRAKGPFIHTGIYLGDGTVLHNTPEKGEHRSTLAEFATEHEVNVAAIPNRIRISVLERVTDTLLFPRKFNLLTNNCEHTVNRILFAKEFSSQLRIWTLVAILTGATLMFIARSRRG